MKASLSYTNDGRPVVVVAGEGAAMQVDDAPIEGQPIDLPDDFFTHNEHYDIVDGRVAKRNQPRTMKRGKSLEEQLSDLKQLVDDQAKEIDKLKKAK